MTEGLTKVDTVAADFLSRIEARQAEIDHLPKCPKCGDTLDGGECFLCRERAEQERVEVEKARAWDIKRLGGLKAYEAFTFAKYGNQAAIDKCEGYPDNNLYIWGLAGVGKTHLATAIIRQFKDGIVVKPQHIFRKLRGLKSGEDEQAVIDKLARKAHMVIDDLGVEKSSAFSLSALYEIIEARDMNYTKGLIITSNLSLAGLAERLGDDRITSRIAGMCRVVQITGDDYRIKNQK